MANDGCMPNYRTYGVLLKGLQKDQELLVEKCINGYFADGKERNSTTITVLLDKLLENGCGPYFHTYVSLIVGLCEEGRSLEAEQLFKSMLDKGMCPNEKAYNSLLLVYCRELKIDNALEILAKMTSNDFEPPLVAYKAMICALHKANRIEEARNLFEGMLCKQWSPDEIVWTVLVDGLIKEGGSDLCMSLLHVMESRGREITFQTYMILARELSSQNKSVDMDRVANKLRVSYLCTQLHLIKMLNKMDVLELWSWSDLCSCKFPHKKEFLNFSGCIIQA
ncbi:hypothetical protein H6P81_014817 [Aristolochia fimbriata]|uniref:PROP1-like PPR domain-containing protein n=1 Tax=Aristolochia fimbriata TaxID=158543 RepID=A0AAV7E6N9_ARIFI|nr:hypothetical protein H6P81_014817 [Aristolochia fimbriata]